MERLEKTSPSSPSSLQIPESMTPYQEVMRYLGQGGTDITESLDGGMVITEHTPEGDISSVVGEVDENLPLKSPENVPFSSLSENAKKLYRQLQKERRV